MKVVVTTTGNDKGAPMDSRFGRSPKFLIYNIEEESFEVIDNSPNLNAAQGAGIQAAETIARLGVEALITGHCGPKAFRVLKAAGIKVFTADAASVGEALTAFRGGKLHESASADVDGHW